VLKHQELQVQCLLDQLLTKLNTISTANKVALTSLDLDGGTDIGADLVDADLLIVDDGAGGTNRKSALSRMKKYIFSSVSGDATATDSGAFTISSGANFSSIAENILPSAANTYSLGSSSKEWSDLYMGDGSRIYLGNDQDVYLEHDPDDGVQLHMASAGSIEPTFKIVHNNSATNYNGPSIQLVNNTQDNSSDLTGSFRFMKGSTLNSYIYSSGLGGNSGTGSKIYFGICKSGASANTALTIDGVGLTNGTIVQIHDHNGSNAGLKLGTVLVTATASELNKLDGVTATTAELNILDGVTATAAELNILDGGTSHTSTTLVSSDKVVVNDGGIMKQVRLSDVKTFTNPDIDEIGAGNSDTVLTTYGEIQINSTKNGESIIFNGKNNGGSGFQLLALHGQDATYGQGFVDIYGSVRSGTLLPKNTFANLGSASLRWGDAYFKEYSKLHFGTDQEITLEHDPDDGLILKMTGSSNNDPSFVLISDNANTTGARLRLRQDSASPANGDVVGKIEFSGNDSAGNATNYGQITGHAAAVASGSEVGKITISPYPAIGSTKGISVEGINGSTSKVKVNIDTHNGTDSGLHLNHTLVTASAAELNILDGVTATTAELNLLDGGTSATSTTLVDADRVIVNDNGTMKQVALSDVKTYVNAGGGGGGGGSQLPPEVKTVSTTATLSLTPSNASTYNAIEVIYTATGSSAYTVTLPTAASIEGKKIHVKRLATANITVDGDGSETIDGSATFVLTSQYSSVTLISDGTNWIII